MAETAEEAEMRELEEGVARLNDAGAPLLEAEDAQGCDSKGDALAHSKSSEKRGYSRRGATPAEKEADCASMWSAEADKYAIKQLEGGVPVSKLHEKLDEAGLKPLHTHAKFTFRIVAQRYGHHKQKRGGRRYKPGEHDLDAFTKDQKEFCDTWAVFLHSRLFNEDGTKKKRAGVQTKTYAAMAKEFGLKFTVACGKSKLQEIANAMKFEERGRARAPRESEMRQVPQGEGERESMRLRARSDLVSGTVRFVASSSARRVLGGRIEPLRESARLLVRPRAAAAARAGRRRGARLLRRAAERGATGRPSDCLSRASRGGRRARSPDEIFGNF